MSKSEMIEKAIKSAFKEDLGDGDHSAIACIPKETRSKAALFVKDDGVLAGVSIAKKVFDSYGAFDFKQFLNDGDLIKLGDVAFEVEGEARGILACERLLLNIMQRMSGIATETFKYNKLISQTNAKLLDTRKTTPNFRVFEKEAVLIGGGVNHRFGLYDMIMLKDNHIDFAGSVSAALKGVESYLKEMNKKLPIIIEVRGFDELNEAISCGGFDRVMLDNFTTHDIKKALDLIDGRFKTEASGGITEETIKSYAETGVDFISVGALTHQVKSLDLSLKAI
jgi:nicotinate-nucleotide pyrophosphorylase (carboxylating)